MPSITLTNDHEYFQWIKNQTATSISKFSSDSYANVDGAEINAPMLDEFNSDHLTFRQFKKDLTRGFAEKKHSNGMRKGKFK